MSDLANEQGASSAAAHPKGVAAPADLVGKTVVVTGASSGIGEALAVGFAGAGANVVLTARRLSELERVGRVCAEASTNSVAGAKASQLLVTADVTSEAEVEALVDAVVAEFGGIDVFFANAGVASGGLTSVPMRKLADYTSEVAERILRVNTLGVWACMKHALPKMVPGSSFVVTCGQISRMRFLPAGMLGASKAATEVLVRIAAQEQGAEGVRVNAFDPGGVVDTHLFGPNKLPAAMKERMPWALPEIMVPGALWLASEASSPLRGAFLTAPYFNNHTPEQVLQELAPKERLAHP